MAFFAQAGAIEVVTVTRPTCGRTAWNTSARVRRNQPAGRRRVHRPVGGRMGGRWLFAERHYRVLMS